MLDIRNKNKSFIIYIGILLLFISCGRHEEPGIVQIQYKSESGTAVNNIMTVFKSASYSSNRVGICDTVYTDETGKCNYSTEFECYLQAKAYGRFSELVRYELHFVPDQTIDTVLYID